MVKRSLQCVGLAAVAAAMFLAYIGFFAGSPFVEPAKAATPRPLRRDLAVIYFSGDLGFKLGTSGDVMDRLAAGGIPALGINSATYFRTRRTPAEVADVIAQAASLLSRSGDAPLVLIGQSYGADMLQAGLPLLPPALKARVKAVVLVAPTTTVYFKVSPWELLELHPADAKGIDFGRLLTWVPAICIHGEADRGTLCPELTQPNIIQRPIPGGHLMQRDAEAIYNAMRPVL